MEQLQQGGTGRSSMLQWTYSRLETHVYPFIPCLVETYGRLNMPAVSLLSQLVQEAEDTA
jgi:hypothetical protein